MMQAHFVFWQSIHFAAKLVSVAFVFFGRAFPTFSFSFWKSFFRSFLCLLDFVIVVAQKKADQSVTGVILCCPKKTSMSSSGCRSLTKALA